MSGLKAICQKNAILKVVEKPKHDMKNLNGKLYIDYSTYNFYFMKCSEAILNESKALRIQLDLERENKKLNEMIDALQSRLTDRLVKPMDPQCKMIIMKGGKND